MHSRQIDNHDSVRVNLDEDTSRITSIKFVGTGSYNDMEGNFSDSVKTIRVVKFGGELVAVSDRLITRYFSCPTELLHEDILPLEEVVTTETPDSVRTESGTYTKKVITGKGISFIYYAK